MHTILHAHMQFTLTAYSAQAQINRTLGAKTTCVRMQSREAGAVSTGGFPLCALAGLGLRALHVTVEIFLQVRTQLQKLTFIH